MGIKEWHLIFDGERLAQVSGIVKVAPQRGLGSDLGRSPCRCWRELE
jgi:hypothetical protein